MSPPEKLIIELQELLAYFSFLGLCIHFICITINRENLH